MWTLGLALTGGLLGWAACRSARWALLPALTCGLLTVAPPGLFALLRMPGYLGWPAALVGALLAAVLFGVLPRLSGLPLRVGLATVFTPVLLLHLLGLLVALSPSDDP